MSGQNDFEEDSQRFRRDHRDPAPPPSSTKIVDSDDYHRVLKSKLETECATAVALRAGSVKLEGSTTSPETQSQPAQSSPLTQGF